MRLTRERGQSLVELAIILPVLLLVVMAALDFGRVFLGWVVLNNAARVGANYAALHPDAWGTPGDASDQTEFENLVRAARADAAITLTGCDIEVVPAPTFPDGTDIGDPAVLGLTCDFSPLTPIIGDVFAGIGNPLAVSASSVFPVRRGVLAAAGPTPPPVCPLADFDVVPNPGTVNEPLTFTDTSAGSPSTWAWDFGDGATSTSQSPQHTYTSTGTYTVTLTVDGCSTSPPVDVTVTDPPPSPDPSASPAASPSPEPPCIVPGLAGTRKNDAQDSWDSRGFTTLVQFLPGNGNYLIEYQSVVGEQEAPCNVEITVGPDPVP